MAETTLAGYPKDKIDVAEKYLDRMLAKLESAKTDLEKNWLGQITSISISLALVAGLGEAIANKLLSDRASANVLFAVFPVVNTYFFIRFGLIAGVFSKARYYSERLTKELVKHHDLPAFCDVSQIYRTNSYFEWAHEEYSLVTAMFLLTIPLTFALNHALTLYLLFKLLGFSMWYLVVMIVYVGVVGTCYYSYYGSNKRNTVVLIGEEKRSFIIVAIVTATVATALVLWGLFEFDPDPRQIDLRPGSARSLSQE